MKSTSCCVEKKFHEKMRDLKGKFSLDPILLIITTFPKFYAWNVWGYVLYEPLMIIIALMLASMEKKTNDEMDPAEYVADADECD